MSGKLAWLEKHPRAAAFAVTFLIFMVLHYAENIQLFQWDAGTYWRLSAVHSLLHFPATVIRGYFYPTLLAPSRYLSDLYPQLGHYFAFRVLSSAIYAYMLGVVLPDFYRTVFGGRVTFWRRLVVPLLVSSIFPGLVVYPLSDLPAVCLILGAAACGMRSVAYDERSITRYGLLLLSGILIYGAYNTRTIFLFPALLMVLAVPLILYRGQRGKLKLIALTVLLCGIVIAGIPQQLINVKNHKGWSPAVVTTAEDKSLFARQLLWGITAQRYETNIGTLAPGPQVFYADAAGRQLSDSLHIDADSFTVADYMGLLVTHPLDFAGIYGRHFINGLDVRDGRVYITTLSMTRDAFAFCNFLVVFLGLSIMLVAAFRHPPTEGRNAIRWSWVLIALLPVLAIIPGAIETRFFLALHLAIYSAIAFGGDVSSVLVALRRHWLVIALAFGVSAGCFFSITLSAMAGAEYGPDQVPITTQAEGSGDTSSPPIGPHV